MSFTPKEVANHKNPQGKLRYRLLRGGMPNALEYVIKVLTYGLTKYPQEHNWQQVPNAMVEFRDALDRHLHAMDKGEIIDPESGEPHMAHAASNALMWLEMYHKEIEDNGISTCKRQDQVQPTQPSVPAVQGAQPRRNTGVSKFLSWLFSK